jgi:HEAT repeat protein
MYGFKFGNRLLRLDILYDSIAAIKKRLPNTVPGLLEALASKDYLVKRCAGEALVKLGPGARAAFPTLLKRFQQGDQELEWVITELAKAAGASAVPPLLEALRDTDSTIRQKAAEALGEIGNDARAAVPELTLELQDSAAAVVLVSALSLRKIDPRDHAGVPALITLLADPNPEIRAGAICVLGEYGPDAAGAVPPLLKVWEDDQSNLRGWAARTLGMIGPDARAAIPRLIAMLDTADQQNLTFAAEALSHFGEEAKAAIPKLLTLAEKPEHSWAVFTALSAMGSDAVPGLVEIYRQADGRHWWAAKALMKQGPKAVVAVPALLEDLRSDNTRRAALAAQVLGCIGEGAKEALPRLAELIHREDPHLRLRAAETLWKLDRQTNAVLEVMVAELDDWAKDPNALIGVAEDANGQSRQQVAATILGEMGPAAKEAIPGLQMMLRSSFQEQREPAAKALEKITGQASLLRPPPSPTPAEP